VTDDLDAKLDRIFTEFKAAMYQAMFVQGGSPSSA
jgi:hypothetical protein